MGAMKHDARLEEVSFSPCRYGTSRLLFRGPRRALDGRHVAFVGGTETFGKSVDLPFPAIVEEILGETCVNLGQVNGSVDVLTGDAVVVDACRDAQVTVMEVTGAHNMSNRFYTVHPRRNDRFVQASSILRAIFPEVDFADFCFTRHLLTHLYELAPDRFAILREELQLAWLARTRGFLQAIGPNTILLWFSPVLPSDTAWEEREDPLRFEPLFVTRRMIDQLRPLVRAVVMVVPSSRARDGMDTADAVGAVGLLGPEAHREAAQSLAEAIRMALSQGRAAERVRPSK